MHYKYYVLSGDNQTNYYFTNSLMTNTYSINLLSNSYNLIRDDNTLGYSNINNGFFKTSKTNLITSFSLNSANTNSEVIMTYSNRFYISDWFMNNKVYIESYFGGKRMV